MEKFTYLRSSNIDYIDEIFAQYQANPDSVDESWRYFFEGLELGTQAGETLPNGHANGHAAPATTVAPAAGIDLAAEARVAELIQAYREFGKLVANLNPLDPPPASSHPLLELSPVGLANADLTKTFQAGKLIGMSAAKLSDIVARLRETYSASRCRIPAHREPHRARMASEAHGGQRESRTDRNRYQKIYFEAHHRRLRPSSASCTPATSRKNASRSKAANLIPTLDCMIEVAAELGAKEFVFGMAHRGRLNVLANLFGKKPELIFTEFEGHVSDRSYRSEAAT